MMAEPQFKHKLVKGLYEIFQEQGEAKDSSTAMFFGPMWIGIRGILPEILKMLDDNDNAVAMLREKLKAVIAVEEEEGPSELVATAEGKEESEVSQEANKGLA